MVIIHAFNFLWVCSQLRLWACLQDGTGATEQTITLCASTERFSLTRVQRKQETAHVQSFGRVRVVGEALPESSVISGSCI